MPMYEYKCDDCGEKFEAIARTTEKDIVECPKCGKKARKLTERDKIDLNEPPAPSDGKEEYKREERAKVPSEW